MARGIIFKDNGINELSNSPSGYKYLGYDGESLSEKSGATVSAIGGVSSIKLYKAIISQNNTDAPTVIVLENTLGGSIVWTRINQGIYQGTLSNGFTIDKTFAIVNSGTSGQATFDLDIGLTVNSIMLTTYTSIGASSDGVLHKGCIEIQVYP